MLKAALFTVVLGLLAAACGGGSSAPRTPGAAPAPPTKVTLDGETFIGVRTLPPAALSAEQLEAAGTATAPGGARVQLARASAADVADWELVSVSPDGWRVWRPQAVLDAVAAAGGGASIVAVERTSWPDACLGAARPGEVCAQVVTPGYRVVLSRDGKAMEYHTDLHGGARAAERS